VFFRSLATRGARELPDNIPDIITACKAARYDLVILETPGIGQGDAAVVELADVSLYMMTPEYGAASQLEKIDMLGFADVVAVNKFERRRAADALRDVTRAEPGLGQDLADCALAGSMAQAGRLALDSAVSPSRVLPGQVQDQVADLLCDGRASSPARVGPFPFDQTTVPGEQGAGRHDPMSPQALRQQSCQCSEHTAVGPIRLRAGDLTSQYRDLMPQHQNLQILRAATTAEQREPGEHARHGEVYEAEEHELRGWEPSSDALHEFWHPTGAPDR